MCKTEIFNATPKDNSRPETSTTTIESGYKLREEEKTITAEEVQQKAEPTPSRCSSTAQEQDAEIGGQTAFAAAQIDCATAEQEGKWKSLLKGLFSHKL